jgi:hypothetical protein
MSRVFTDPDLVTWEAYASSGQWGLPEQPKIVFNCLSDPDRRARFVIHDGHSGGAQESLSNASDDQLRKLLRESQAL